MPTLPDSPETYKQLLDAVEFDPLTAGPAFEHWLATYDVSEAELSRRSGVSRRVIQACRRIPDALPAAIQARRDERIEWADLKAIVTATLSHEGQMNALQYVLSCRDRGVIPDEKQIIVEARAHQGGLTDRQAGLFQASAG